MLAIFFSLASTCTMAQTLTSEWPADQLAAANTAKDVPYLSHEEKQVILLTNLARTDGQLFVRTLLDNYLQSKGNSKRSRYVASLISDLNKVKGLPILQLNEKLCQSAAFHAHDMGMKGLTGHNSSDGTIAFTRIKRFLKPTGNYTLAENCSYGFSKALDIVMQLLIDEGVRDIGHRKNLLSTKLDQVGVAIQPHQSAYRYNFVQDFASLK